jgi:hypothetical protein
MEFTAADAKKLVANYNDVLGGVLAEEFNGYIKTIKGAATKGGMCIHVYKRLPVAIAYKLQEYGFEIDYTAHRNEDLTTISW